MIAVKKKLKNIDFLSFCLRYISNTGELITSETSVVEESTLGCTKTHHWTFLADVSCKNDRKCNVSRMKNFQPAYGGYFWLPYFNQWRLTRTWNSSESQRSISKQWVISKHFWIILFIKIGSNKNLSGLGKKKIWVSWVVSFTTN